MRTPFDQYDVVIIDGPPVLGLADAPRLSSVADATVFVIEANRTSKDDAKIALKRLGDAGADQIGLVISKYDPDKDPIAGPKAAPQPPYQSLVLHLAQRLPDRASRTCSILMLWS